MIKRFICLLILLFPLLGFCQDQTNRYQLTENDSLYLAAIELFTVEIDLFYNKYGEKDFGDILYLEYQDYLYRLPDTINGYKIIFLGLHNQRKHFKQQKNKLRYIKIRPLSFENDSFKIRLTPYFATLKKRKHLLLELSDYTDIYFRYENGRLIYDFSKNGGI